MTLNHAAPRRLGLDHTCLKDGGDDGGEPGSGRDHGFDDSALPVSCGLVYGLPMGIVLWGMIYLMFRIAVA